MSTAVLTRAVPKYQTRRRPERDTYGPRIAAVFTLLTGFEPMPWQLDAWDLLGEMFTDDECYDRGKPKGTPAYRENVWSIGRRGAKTLAAWGVLTDQCIRPQTGPLPAKGLYGAQTGKDGTKKFKRDILPLFHERTIRPEIRRRFDRPYMGSGDESLQWRNGAAIYLGGNTSVSEHGGEFDTAVIDEAMADKDSAREGALAPGQLTMPKAQRIITSNAGTHESLYWNNKLLIAREACLADSGEGLALIEYGIGEGDDILDPDAVARNHPAVGYSVDIGTIMYEIESMAKTDRPEAERAYGNRPTIRLFSQHLPADKWAAACDPSYRAKGPRVRWGFAVSEDRSMSAIAAYNLDTCTVAVTDHKPGTDWVAAKAQERAGRAPVSYDATGPAGNIGAPHTKWHGLGHRDMTAAFAELFDAVTEERIKVKADEALDRAVSAADVRTSEGSRKWSRSLSPVDISTLEAVTIAVGHGVAPKQRQPMALI